MYTVIRFECDQSKNVDLVAYGEKLNRRRPGLFDGLDHVEGRFSCSVSSAPEWEEQLADIKTFINEFAEVIAEARQNGIHIELDVMIDLVDLKGKFYRSFDLSPEVMEQLVKAQVRMMFTCYSDPGEK